MVSSLKGVYKMSYIALKPCTFAGQKYKIGEEIPAETVHPGSRENLVKMGLIAARGDSAWVLPEKVATQDLSIKLKSEEGESVLAISKQDLQAIFDVLSQKATDAEAAVKALTNVDALELLSACDARKTIKELAKARIAALEEEVAEAEEPTEAGE